MKKLAPHYPNWFQVLFYLMIETVLWMGVACSDRARAGEHAKRNLGPTTNASLFKRIGQVDGDSYSDHSPFSADGSAFITMADGAVRVYDSQTLNPLTDALRHPNAVAYRLTADGKTIFTADGREVWIWDAASSKRRSVTRVSDQRIDTLEVSPDGKRFITSVGDNILTLWNVGQPFPTAKLLQGISLPVGIFDPTGRKIVTHAHARGFHIWAAENGTEICPMIVSDFNGFAPFDALGPFDPDGHRLLLPLWYGGFLVIDPATGKTLSKVPLPQFREAQDLSFADDGNKIVALSYEGGQYCPVRVYNSKTLTLEREFGKWIIECQTAARGHLALCIPENAPAAERFEIWDLNIGSKVQAFAVLASNYRAYLSPDGSTVLVNSSKVTEVWRRN